MDSYIDRFEKIEYANAAHQRLAAYAGLSEPIVTLVRGWLREAADLWQEALGRSGEMDAALRTNKPAIEAARAAADKAIDVLLQALKAHASATGSESELRTVFPDGTKHGIGKGDIDRLACLARGAVLVSAEGAPAGIAAHRELVVSAYENYRAAFASRRHGAGGRRAETGSLAAADEEWRKRYFGACEVISGLLRRHGRSAELPTIFLHLAAPGPRASTEAPPAGPGATPPP